MMDLLSIRNLSVRLGNFSLEKVSFGVAEGSYCCLLGASGAGKSVLLETVIGAFPPREGQIFLRGKNVTTLPPERRHLGIVYQDYMLFPHLNVFDILPSLKEGDSYDPSSKDRDSLCSLFCSRNFGGFLLHRGCRENIPPRSYVLSTG